MRVAYDYNRTETVEKCGMCTTFLVHEILQILVMKSVIQDNNDIVMKYTHDGLLLSLKKEGRSDTGCNIDEP